MSYRRSTFSASIIALLLVMGLSSAKAQANVEASGRVVFGEIPLCSLVLINGQSEFSCGGDGRYNLEVPLDGNGLLTVQVFASGFAPSNTMLTPQQAINYQVDMTRVVNGRTFEVDSHYSDLGVEGRAFVSGTVQVGSTPVCALILANGQKMFSCETDLGQFGLDVPLDQDGNITLQIFADGFTPYSQILRGGDPTKPNNLTAASLENETLDPRIGYPLTVTLTMDAIEFVRDVGVTFHAFDSVQPDVRQFSLGARTIEEVGPGGNVFEFELEVPTEIANPGTYYIAVSVDGADAISETNEDDNETYFETTLSAKELPNLFIEFMRPDRTAIVLDRKAWDYQEQISANGEIVSDAGGTVTYGVKGVDRPIEVEAFATLRLIRSGQPGGPITPFAITRTGDSLDVPLYLWNSEADRYNHAYGVDPKQGIDTGAEEWLPIGRAGQLALPSSSEFDLRSAHLDYYFPGRLAEEIEIALRHLNVFLGGPIVPPPDLSAADIQALRSFLFGADLEDVSSELCLSIRPVDTSVVEDRIDDNQVCSPLALLLPPVELQPPPPPVPPPVPPIYKVPSVPIFADALYRAGWPGSYFGASVDFSAFSSVDTNGAIGASQVEIPVTLFGGSFKFFGLYMRAQLLPLSKGFASDETRARSEQGFSMNVTILNQVIYAISNVESLGTASLSWSVEHPKYLPPHPDDTPDEIKKRKPPYYGAIGPVPVEYRPKITGNIGVGGAVSFSSPPCRLELSLIDTCLWQGPGEPPDEGLEFEIEPFASAEAVLEAKSPIVPFVTVDGVLTLIKVAFPTTSTYSIKVLDGRHADGTSEVVIANQFEVKKTLEGLSGELNAAVQLTGGNSCKKWGIFKFVCKALPDINYSIQLASFEPFEKKQKTLNKPKERVVDVVTRPNNSVYYYQEAPN